MRAVVDTVILLRAIMNPRGTTWADVFAEQHRFTQVSSPELVFEAVRLTQASELHVRLRRLSDEPPMARLLQVLSHAEIVEPQSTPRVCRDPNDDKLLAAALAGEAAYIVSEDRDVLAVGDYHGIRTVRAAEFLKVIRTPPT